MAADDLGATADMEATDIDPSWQVIHHRSLRLSPTVGVLLGKQNFPAQLGHDGELLLKKCLWNIAQRGTWALWSLIHQPGASGN